MILSNPNFNHPCRCNKCRGRKTLRKHPDLYERRHHVKCSCGGEFKVDTYRMSKENKNPCKCDGYWFPHRKGSKWCIHNKRELSEEEHIERFSSW